MVDTTSARSGLVSRRSIIFGGASVVAVGVLAKGVSGGALAQETTATPSADEMAGHDKESMAMLRQKVIEYGNTWQATSPSTHLSDTYTLKVTNTGTTAVKVYVDTMIMDHRQHHNEEAVQEDFELAPGGSKDFSAPNNYGTANHFSTRLATTAADDTMLSLDVRLVDKAGQETASFNQRAFMILSKDDLVKSAEENIKKAVENRTKRRKNRRHKAAGSQNAPQATTGTATPTA